MTGRASDPTPAVRAGTYARDRHVCLSCGLGQQLTYQHRQSVGMGGGKRRPRFEEGLTACMDCNPRFERDLQRQALEFGWKVARWVRDPGAVPVFSWPEKTWYQLDRLGGRRMIGQERAMELMQAVYGDAYRPGRGLVA